MTSRKL